MNFSHSNKIVSVTIQSLHAPLSVPFRTALGQHSSLENILFTIELASGIKGYGEAGVATHITGETIPKTKKNLNEIASQIVNQKISSVKAISAIAKELAGSNGAARAAVEMAVLDAYTKTKKIPFWKLFGVRLRPIQTDMTVVIDSVENSVKLAKAICARGIRTLKIKVGRDETLDFERVQKVCQIAGNRNILIDGNQGYSAAQMIRLIGRLKNIGIIPALVEQPVLKEDWEGLREVTRKTGLVIAADETVRSFADAKKLIRGKYANAINIKFMKCGILEALKITKLAKRNHIRLMIGQMMESELATTAAAQFASGLGGFQFADLDAPLFLKKKAMSHSYLNRSGIYDLRKVKEGIGTQPSNLAGK